MDTRRVSVVNDRDVFRKTVQQAYLLGRERCPGRRNDVLDTRLVHRNHIGIAFDHDGEVELLDRLLGEIESVQLTFLAVYLALGRILVLGNGLVGTQRTAAESDDAPRNVMYGENHPVAEAVVERTVALAFERKAGRDQELLFISRRQRILRHPVATRGAEPEAELLDRGVGHAALLAEIGHTHAHALGLVVQVVGEIIGRPAVEREHRFAVVVAAYLFLGHLLLLDLDAVSFGHHLQGFGIGDVLVLHQERDGIAAFAAAEAFIYPLRGRHDERRGFLVVERAAGLIVHTLALERDVLADNIHDIGGCINAVYCFPVDHVCKDSNNSPTLSGVQKVFAGRRRSVPNRPDVFQLGADGLVQSAGRHQASGDDPGTERVIHLAAEAALLIFRARRKTSSGRSGAYLRAPCPTPRGRMRRHIAAWHTSRS